MGSLLCHWSTILNTECRKKAQAYLNLPDTRAVLGVSEKRGNWSACDYDILYRFGNALDMTGHTTLYVANLLERGVRVLNYVGTFDYICESDDRPPERY